MTNFRTPLKRATGLGSAHHGTHHFLAQRLTALALIVLGLWFLWLVLRLPALDYAAARSLLAEPHNALCMALFAVAAFWHAQLGLQVVVEDYVHTHGWQLLLQVGIRFLCILGAAASVFAVLRIALGH